MTTKENSQEVPATPEVSGGETTEEIKLSKSEYEELVGIKSSYGSLKREMKDLKKSLETRAEEKEAPESNPSKEDFGLLHKAFLRSNGISNEDEVELAKEIQKKTGMEWDQLVDDEYFQTKLTTLRRQRDNIFATSNVSGGPGQSIAKDNPAYWLAKGAPPTSDQVPNRQLRAKIVRAFMDSANTGKKFYDD